MAERGPSAEDLADIAAALAGGSIEESGSGVASPSKPTRRSIAPRKKPAAASTASRRTTQKKPAAAKSAMKKPAAAMKRPAAAPRKRPATAPKKKPAAASRKKPAAARAGSRAARGRAAGGRESAPKKARKQAPPVDPAWAEQAKIAEKAYSTYFENCNFPEWSMEKLAAGALEEYARTVVVYYSDKDDFGKVQRVATQREPANMAMTRCYDEDLFEELLGYRHGAYQDSDATQLMPNIAAFCKTPMQAASGAMTNVNVINVIGYGFDSEDQPDWTYFMPLIDNPAKWRELVQCMQQMWRFIYECAKRNRFKRVYLPDIGGGNFAAGLDLHEETSYQKLKEESLLPVQEEYAAFVETHRLERVPDWCFTEEAEEMLPDSLLVNAWDPWCLVGNANFADNSLDGFFGRCTAMALLCWPKTNPHLRWESVKAKKS